MTTEKNNNNKYFYLILNLLISLILTSCANNRTPSIYKQVPMQKEVVGIADNVRVWRDYRGIFYYVDGNGNQTDEPVYLSQERCSGQKRPQRQMNFGILQPIIAIISLFNPNRYNKHNQDEIREAIEMQCIERNKWERSYKRHRRRRY